MPRISEALCQNQGQRPTVCFTISHWSCAFGLITGGEEAEERGCVERWPWTSVKWLSGGQANTSKISHFCPGEEWARSAEPEAGSRNRPVPTVGMRKGGRAFPEPGPRAESSRRDRIAQFLKKLNGPWKKTPHVDFFTENEDEKIPIGSKK